MIKETLNIINNPKMRGYKYKYLKGLKGLVIGIILYIKNKRYKEDYKPMTYISYFIVKEITGEEPK